MDGEQLDSSPKARIEKSMGAERLARQQFGS
jgi:hypothetical protein